MFHRSRSCLVEIGTCNQKTYSILYSTTTVLVCMTVDFELWNTNVVTQTILQHPFSEIAMNETLDAVARILQQPSNRQIRVSSIEIDLGPHFPIYHLPRFKNLYPWTFVSIYQSATSWYVRTWRELAPVYWSSKWLPHSSTRNWLIYLIQSRFYWFSSSAKHMIDDCTCTCHTLTTNRRLLWSTLSGFPLPYHGVPHTVTVWWCGDAILAFSKLSKAWYTTTL